MIEATIGNVKYTFSPELLKPFIEKAYTTEDKYGAMGVPVKGLGHLIQSFDLQGNDTSETIQDAKIGFWEDGFYIGVKHSGDGGYKKIDYDHKDLWHFDLTKDELGW